MAAPAVEAASPAPGADVVHGLGDAVALLAGVALVAGVTARPIEL